MEFDALARLPIVDLFGLAESAKRRGEGAAAVALYKNWIACHDDDPVLYAAYFNYATALTDAGDLFGAIIAFRESARLKPEFHQARLSLGLVLERVGQSGKAIGHWLAVAEALSAVNRESLTQRITALENTGRVLEILEQDAAAEDALRQRLELARDDKVIQHWIALRMRQCKWPVLDTSDALTRRDLLAGISPLSAATLADDPLFQLAVSHHYGRALVGRPQPLPPAGPRAPLAGRRLRIGYVSSDFRDHAVGFSIVDTLETHDRARFEIFGYYCGIARDDSTKARIKAAVDHWLDINGMSDEAVAARIRDDGVDILVDLNGYTKDARTRVFALQPAPIAVNWFGFPATMGTPYHHYIIADPWTVPPGSEHYVSETVIRLRCYQPNDRRRVVSDRAPSRRDENLPETGVVFCSLNGLQKLNADTFALWLAILGRVPGSVLWLLGGTLDTQARLRGMAAAQGIAPERLIFAGKTSNPEHVARYALADLFLDASPYGAHTTAADALWMGVPVLTCPGRSFASRVCASLVAAAGLPELICTDAAAYVARAVDLGTDAATLAGLKTRLREGRTAALLFDTPRLVAGLEEAYGAMWADYEAGRRPVPDLDGLDLLHEIGVDSAVEAAQGLDAAAYRAFYRERVAGLAPAWADRLA